MHLVIVSNSLKVHGGKRAIVFMTGTATSMARKLGGVNTIAANRGARVQCAARPLRGRKAREIAFSEPTIFL